MSVQPTGLTLIKLKSDSTDQDRYINTANIAAIEKVPDGTKLTSLDNRPLAVIKRPLEEVMDKLDENEAVGRVIDLTA